MNGFVENFVVFIGSLNRLRLFGCVILLFFDFFVFVCGICNLLFFGGRFIIIVGLLWIGLGVIGGVVVYF